MCVCARALTERSLSPRRSLPSCSARPPGATLVIKMLCGGRGREGGEGGEGGREGGEGGREGGRKGRKKREGERENS